MAICFLIPITIAYIVYINIGEPKHTLNHGTLFKPTTPFNKEIIFTHVNGKSSTVKALQGSWWLWYVTNNECAANCKHTMYNLRQVHRALGKNYHRVHRMYVYVTQNPATMLNSIKSEYPEQIIVTTEQKIFSQFLNNTLKDDKSPYEKVYLIDPLGNLVMHYNTDSINKGLLHDLKKLLKLSRIG